MTTDIQQRPAVAPVAPVSLRSRLFGLGSVFGKEIRDSRRAFGVEVAFLGGFLLLVLAGAGNVYPTQAARDELVRLANGIGPAAQGIAGKPVNVGTMGGYVQWKYGSVFLLIAAFWSILALTRTLAGEARRGSLELVTASPLRRRRIAVEKVAAHLALLAVVMAVLAFAAWLAGAAFAKLPGDEIPLQAAVGLALWIGLMTLAFGGLAFALSQFLGRAAAAWIAGFILVAGPLLNNYQTLVPAFRGVAKVTPWAWTADHLPLAGRYDWASLVPVAGVAAVLILIGIEAFVRRDLGASSTLRTPRLPAAALGLRGPVGRSFGERLPLALAWGLGLGAFGLIMAAGSRSLADQLVKSPDLAKTFHGLGVFAAIGLMTVIMALSVGLGAALARSDVLTPMAGTFALGLFGAALAGVGFAVGGLVRTSVAARVVAAVVIATYLIDLLVPALRLPDWVHRLALTAHLGQPMVGVWDMAGVVACLVLAVGGLALGGLGFARRDVRS